MSKVNSRYYITVNQSFIAEKSKLFFDRWLTRLLSSGFFFVYLLHLDKIFEFFFECFGLWKMICGIPFSKKASRKNYLALMIDRAGCILLLCLLSSLCIFLRWLKTNQSIRYWFSVFCVFMLYYNHLTLTFDSMRSYKWVNVDSFSILKLFQLKVSKFQNESMNLSFLQKYEPKIVRISAL